MKPSAYSNEELYRRVADRFLTPGNVALAGVAGAGLLFARQALFAPKAQSPQEAVAPPPERGGNPIANFFLGPTTFEWGRGSGFGVSDQHILSNITKEYAENSDTEATREGTRIHEKIQKALKGITPSVKEEYYLRDPAARLTGHIDILLPTVYNGQKTFIPTEIKTVQDEAALEALSGIKPEQRAQGQFYLHYLSNENPDAPPPGEFFLYTTREDQSRYKLFFMQRDESEFQQKIQHYRQMQRKAEAAGLTPKRLEPEFLSVPSRLSQWIGNLLPTREYIPFEQYESKLHEAMQAVNMQHIGMKQEDMSNVYGAIHGAEPHSELRKSSGHAMQSPISSMVMLADDVAVIGMRSGLQSMGLEPYDPVGYDYEYRDPLPYTHGRVSRIPRGIRSSSTPESSYSGFEAMKPHPGTDFPGGRISGVAQLIKNLGGYSAIKGMTSDELVAALSKKGVDFYSSPELATLSGSPLGVLFNETISKAIIADKRQIRKLAKKHGIKITGKELNNDSINKVFVLHEVFESLAGKQALNTKTINKAGSHISGYVLDEEIRISKVLGVTPTMAKIRSIDFLEVKSLGLPSSNYEYALSKYDNTLRATKDLIYNDNFYKSYRTPTDAKTFSTVEVSDIETGLSSSNFSLQLPESVQSDLRRYHSMATSGLSTKRLSIGVNATTSSIKSSLGKFESNPSRMGVV